MEFKTNYIAYNSLKIILIMHFLTKEFVSINEVFKLTIELVPNLTPIIYS